MVMPNSIIILNCNVVKEFSILQKDSYIAIKNGLISEIGSMDQLPSHDGSTVIDGSGKLLISGLLNGHNHSAMTLFRGMADDLQLDDWLHNHIFPAEARHVSEEMVYWCCKLAAAEMLLSGTTCVADGYFFSDQTARAFEEAGLRAIVAHGILDFPAPGVTDPSKNIETVAKFVHKWKNRATTITPAVFAHSPYTCSPETLKKAKRLADDNDVRFYIHLAESRYEQDMIIDAAGSSPVKHLNNLNILDPNCICVHSVWLDDEDLDILASSNAQVIVCPQSNYKLASGYARVNDMVRRKIPVGLGTDGCASNNSLDMFREMDLFAKSQKAHNQDPTTFPASKVLHMATSGNNGILGFTSPITISPGNRADLILIDLNAPHLTPFYNQDLLVYGARGSDVDCVIVDGKIVVKNKKLLTIDLHETQEKVNELAAAIKGEKIDAL